MTKEISEFRAKIDAIDDELIELLNRRSKYVLDVGAIKKATQKEGVCYIRSAREADMVRRMFEAFRGGTFPPLAAAHVWRIIISASLSLESPLNVTAYSSDPAQEIYWLTREYFGNFTPIVKEASARRILGEVMEGRAQVGTLPPPDDTAEGKWWLRMPADIRIFACIPFLLPKNGQVKAFAVAKLEPEETGNDVSFFSIETEHEVSQSRVKAVLDKHKLEMRWLASESFASGHRVHLIEMKGFITGSHEFVSELKGALGTSLVAIHWLGAYALPVQS